MSARERILAALAALDGDEAEVLARCAERVVEGRRHYGSLKLATDARDFRAQCAEELLDAIFYAACEVLRGGKPWGPVEAPEGRMVGAEREG